MKPDGGTGGGLWSSESGSQSWFCDSEGTLGNSSLWAFVALDTLVDVGAKTLVRSAEVRHGGHVGRDARKRLVIY